MQARTPTALVAAGLVTWAVMATGWILSGGLREPAPKLAAALACWGAFAACFWFVAATERTRRAEVMLIAAQSAAALGLAALGHGGFSGVLFAVIAGQLGMVLPVRSAGAWIAGQSVLGFALMSLHAGATRAALTSVGYFAFQLFAAGAAWLARREAEGRAELQRVNAELLATQSLLQDSTRAAERLRISRELHDTVGHHLTALALHLEVAKNTAPGNEAVTKSQEIARAMLAEVRDVVGALRDERALDLRHALEVLVSGVPAPRVHLTLAEDLTLIDPAVAHAAFRTVQEAITNAVRHASAENLWIDVRLHAGALCVEVRDDGRGAAELTPGHGLTGLRERVSALGGALEVEAAPGRGLQLRASMPLRGAPA